MIGCGALLFWLWTAGAQELVPPTIVDCPTPVYPVGVDAGRQRVTALLRIDGSGTVANVAELEGDPLFVAQIEPVASSCRFTPALEDGQPITVDQPFAWEWPDPDVNLSGTVVTRGDRVAVADAIVHLLRRDPSGTERIDRLGHTDASGAFAFRNVGPGPLVVHVRADGVRIPDLPLEGPPSPSDVVELELWAFRETSREDELIGVYDPNAPGPTRRTLDREAIRAVPGSLGDPIRALQSQPGFARAPFEAGWLLVRGGGPDDTGMYLDGVRIPLLYHMGGFTSVMHPELTEAVDYWAGAQPARYQGTSGAVNVRTADVGDRARVVAGVNLAWAHAFVEAPTRFGGVAFAARRSYLDGAIALALGPEAAAIAPKFTDVQGTVQVGDASFTGLWLRDALEVPSLDGGTLTVTQVGAQLQGRIPIDAGPGTVTIQPWIARHGRGLDAFSPAGDLVDAQALIERFPGIRIGYASPPTAAVRLDTGVEAEYRSWGLQLDTRSFDRPGGRIDPWIQASTGRVVQFESGIRLDTLMVREQLPRAEASPRAAVRWNLSRDLSVHGELGRFHTIPEVLLLAGLPEGAYMPMEQSDLVSVGTRARREQWAFEADVYSRRMAYIAALENDGTVALMQGRARGIETQITWKPELGTLSLLYQLGSSTQQRKPRGEPMPAVFDQPHRLQVLALGNLPKDWKLSGRFRYGSGFPKRVDPFTGTYIPFEALDLLTQEVRPVGHPDRARLPAFHALDLKVLKEVQLRKWRLDFWLDIQNVYNRRVIEPFITGFPESSLTYGFGLPVLPIFGVEGVWWPGKGRRDATGSPSATAD